MRRVLTGVLFAACLQGQTIDRTKPPETPPLPPFKIPAMTESKLTNGLTLVTLQDNRFPLVTVRLAFPTGSRFDPKDKPGLAEAVASLLTEGTKSRVSRQIAEEVNEIGGSLSASASADSLILAGSALSESTEKLIDLVADVARNAMFPADEVALYKQNRKQQLLEQRSQSEFLADEKVKEVVFGDHPYSRQNPTPQSIDALDTAVLAGFRDRLLAPNQAVLILLGKLPARPALLKVLEAKFAGWQKREVPAPPSGPLPAARRSITLVDRPGSVQADVHVGHLGITRTDPAYFALTVGNAILGGGTASRLFNGIREKKGYAYSVYSYNQAQKDAALFSAAMQVRNEVVGDAVAELLAELKKMANEPVSGQELSSVKNYLSGNFVIRMQSQDALATQIVTVKSMGLPKDYLEMYTQRIRSAEPDQILNAAKRVMDPETSALVVVGDAKQIKSKLDKLGTVDVVPSK
ncbi:MAG: M16 family metallopeptidase [Bryobacteraceae bacterium]